jgi:hypothetical protein
MIECLTISAAAEKKPLMSNRLSRSLQRKNDKHKIKQKKKKLDKQLKLNKLLPDKCVVCFSEFNETDKKMINEWHIIIEHEESNINLYCPMCWEEQT